MRGFPNDAEKPGRRVLVIGAIAYLLVVALCLVWLAIDDGGQNPLLVLLVFPLAAPLVGLPLGWMAFWVGFVTGVPVVSYTYALSAAKRNYRGVLGWLLLASVLLAGAVAVSQIP